MARGVMRFYEPRVSLSAGTKRSLRSLPRGIVLTHAVRQEAVNSDAEDYDLRPGALPEQALQSVEPIVIAGGLQENGIHTDLRSNQVLQTFCVHTL